MGLQVAIGKEYSHKLRIITAHVCTVLCEAKFLDKSLVNIPKLCLCSYDWLFLSLNL